MKLPANAVNIYRAIMVVSALTTTSLCGVLVYAYKSYSREMIREEIKPMDAKVDAIKNESDIRVKESEARVLAIVKEGEAKVAEITKQADAKIEITIAAVGERFKDYLKKSDYDGDEKVRTQKEMQTNTVISRLANKADDNRNRIDTVSQDLTNGQHRLELMIREGFARQGVMLSTPSK